MQFRSDFTSADLRQEFRDKAAELSHVFASENIRGVGKYLARYGETALKAELLEKRIQALMFANFTCWDDATSTDYKPIVTVSEDQWGPYVFRCIREMRKAARWLR